MFVFIGYISAVRPSAIRRLLLSRQTIKIALLLITIWLLASSTLLESRLILRKRDFELSSAKMSTMNRLLELLRALKLLEAYRNDTVLFLIEQRDVRDFAERFGFLAHILFDFEYGSVIFVELGKREGITQYAYLCPLVFLGRKGFGDFFFVVRPFCEFAVST